MGFALRNGGLYRTGLCKDRVFFGPFLFYASLVATEAVIRKSLMLI